MRTLLLIGIGLIVVYGVIWVARADYRAFDEAREDWHRRCDRFVGVKTSDPRAAACEDEAQALIAYAKRKGWG